MLGFFLKFLYINLTSIPKSSIAIFPTLFYRVKIKLMIKCVIRNNIYLNVILKIAIKTNYDCDKYSCKVTIILVPANS